MSFLLKHTNAFREVHFFVRFGPEYRGVRLIEHVTTDPREAHEFDTAPEAAEALILAGKPVEWTIEEKP